MTIKLNCKACSKELDIPDSFAGKKGKCPFCMEVLDIPAADGQPVDIPTEPGELPEPKPEDQPQPAPAVDPEPLRPEPEQAPQPAAAPRLAVDEPSPGKLRLSVLLPAAFLVVAAVVAALIINERLQIDPTQAPTNSQHTSPQPDKAGIDVPPTE